MIRIYGFVKYARKIFRFSAVIYNFVTIPLAREFISIICTHIIKYNQYFTVFSWLVQVNVFINIFYEFKDLIELFRSLKRFTLTFSRYL